MTYYLILEDFELGTVIKLTKGAIHNVTSENLADIFSVMEYLTVPVDVDPYAADAETNLFALSLEHGLTCFYAAELSGTWFGEACGAVK